MGLATGGTKLLLKEAARRRFEGSVLTLGKQNVFFTHKELVAMAAEFGVELDARTGPCLSPDPEYAKRNFISDTSLFRSLGARECYSLDCSDFEGSEFVFDLNRSDLPAELVGRFDLIVDGGTIEHVFHLPNVLNNIFTMLRPGGRVVHLSPSSNHMDHGFYMFSPTLFWDYYCANQFDINSVQVFRYTPNHDTDPWELTDYHPGCLDGVSFGGLDDAMYGICFVATKTSASTGTVIPMQRTYLEWWLRQGKRHDFKDGVSAPEVQMAASTRNRANIPVPVAAPAEVAEGVTPTAVTAPSASEVRAPHPLVWLVRGAAAPCPPFYRLLRRCYRFATSAKSAAPVGAAQPPARPSKGLGIRVVARY